MHSSESATARKDCGPRFAVFSSSHACLVCFRPYSRHSPNGPRPRPVDDNGRVMLTEADILTALRDCFDPEVKLNLVDLGLIYGVETRPDPDSAPAWPRQWVKVTMTLTTQQCPANGLIVEQVSNRLAGIQDISTVEGEVAW